MFAHTLTNFTQLEHLDDSLSIVDYARSHYLYNSWGVVVLHICVMQDNTPGRDITCYLGNITVEERYEQHSYTLWVILLFVDLIISKYIF